MASTHVQTFTLPRVEGEVPPTYAKTVPGTGQGLEADLAAPVIRLDEALRSELGNPPSITVTISAEEQVN